MTSPSDTPQVHAAPEGTQVSGLAVECSRCFRMVWDAVWHKGWVCPDCELDEMTAEVLP